MTPSGADTAAWAGPDTLLLLAHGREEIFLQARFCIMTFQHFALSEAGALRVVVYTDAPEAFAGLGDNVRCERLTREILSEWKGPDRYVHRIKPMTFLHFAGRYSGRFAFVDSDTYFMRPPSVLFDRIRPGSAVLHRNEGMLAERRNANARKLHDFIRQTRLPLADGGLGRIPERTEMWNSGVVGLAPEDRDLLAPSLRMVDALYGRYAKHNMEQLALSYVLGTRLRLTPADDVVYHYWGRTWEFRRIVSEFFENHRGDDLPHLAAAAYQLAPRPGRNPRRRWYQKLLRT